MCIEEMHVASRISAPRRTATVAISIAPALWFCWSFDCSCSAKPQVSWTFQISSVSR